MPMRDPYVVLGVNPTATPEDIKQAWRRLCRIHHPDRKGGSEAMMAEINLAYNMLTDADARGRYDRGEGEERPPIDVRARQIIMQIVFAALTQIKQQTAFGGMDVSGVPMAQFVQENMDNNVRAFKEKVSDYKKIIERVKRERNRTLFTRPGDTVEIVMDQVDQQANESLKNAEGDLETVLRAKELYAEMIVADSEAKRQAELAKPKSKLTWSGIDVTPDAGQTG